MLCYLQLQQLSISWTCVSNWIIIWDRVPANCLLCGLIGTGVWQQQMWVWLTFSSIELWINDQHLDSCLTRNWGTDDPFCRVTHFYSCSKSAHRMLVVMLRKILSWCRIKTKFWTIFSFHLIFLAFNIW